MTHKMNTDLEALMEAQSVLDYHLELGGNIKELRMCINAEITEMSGMISLYHTNTHDMLHKHLPMMGMWCEALEQLNWLESVQGHQEVGVVGMNYLRCAWGLELDLAQGEYNLAQDQMIVPFLNKLVMDVGPLDILDLRNFLELYWGADRIEQIIVEFMLDREIKNTPTQDPADMEPDWDLEFDIVVEDEEEEEEIMVEVEVYQLEVNEVVLREMHHSAAVKVIKAVEMLDACTDVEDERLIRKGMYVNIKIKLECENLVPELAEEFGEGFLQ